MGDDSENTYEKFKQEVCSFDAEQRIWREGRVDELRDRVVGSIRAASVKVEIAMGGDARGRNKET